MKTLSQTAVPWQDSYENTKERKVYTFQEHQIPGLSTFGYHNTAKALTSLMPHYHENCFEFVFLLQGNLQFFTESSSYHIYGGEILITFPSEPHDTGNHPLSMHRMYWFQLDVSDPCRFLYLRPEAARLIIDRLYALHSRVIKIRGTMAASLGEILQNIAAGDPLSRTQAAIRLSDLLCQIIRHDGDSIPALTPDIGRTTAYILDHIEENIPMEKLAEMTFLSVSRFKQKFRTELGTSPRNFINFYKIEAAKEMLEQGRSVTETALALNFSSSNYFSSVFHRYTCHSPSQYRDAHRRASGGTDPDHSPY